MRILVTGADGFIAKNLRAHLREQGHTDVSLLKRSSTPDEFERAIAQVEFVYHLAGVNRPTDERDFQVGNVDLTGRLCAALAASGRAVPIVYASSTHATRDTPYGRSKLAAERVIQEYASRTGAAAWIYRLTNVFGKWARPHYNSAVATFCHQLAHGEEIRIDQPDAPLRLLYVDDVASTFVRLLTAPPAAGFVEAEPVYATTVGEVAETLRGFVASRRSLVSDRVGGGLTRALYATFVSHLPKPAFEYSVPCYQDPRGVFVEMLKTPDCGQFSYFTAKPGISRGEHYHHTKTEKFLVIRGRARFGFRDIDTGDTHEIVTQGGEARIVETIPGWAHNVVNIGDEELVVMLWANEIFDRARPDTYPMKVAP
jgi:UDP-2-acetamido-2,6-beta-L-arabino-hexul-4-ose reductase